MTFNDLFTTFANNLLPVILIAGAGFLLGKYLHIEPRPIGRLVFYLFSPILIFNLLLRNQLPASEMLLTGAFAAAVILGVALIAFLAGLALRLDRSALVAVVITAMFANNGNFGLPLVSFAFGEQALAHSSVYFVTSVILLNTVGVFIASLGHMDARRALTGLLKVPTIYAVVIVFLMLQFKVPMPTPLDRTISIAAGASVPIMLVLLGLELQRAVWSRNLRALTLGTVMRLGVGPLIAFLLTAAFGVTGSGRQGIIIESAMPCAVANTVLASEYKIDSSLVTAIIFISTILSPLTLTPLIVLLK